MTDLRPFRFGVQVFRTNTRWDWQRTCREIEAEGYSSLVVQDHLGDQFGPLAALASAAMVTERLRLATLVLNNDLRHPLVLAKELASIDVLSNGRLEVGLGAGWMEADYRAAGIVQEQPGVRIDRLDEAVTVIRRHLAGVPSRFDGDHYRVDHVAIPPAKQPRVPLLLGGGGRRMLSLAARRADIVGVNQSLAPRPGDPHRLATIGPSYFDERLDWVRAAAGERFDDIELNVLVNMVVLTEDRWAVFEQMAANTGLEADALAGAPLLLVGTHDEMAEDLRRRRERWGFSYVVVKAPYRDVFTPLVAALAGT